MVGDDIGWSAEIIDLVTEREEEVIDGETVSKSNVKEEVNFDWMDGEENTEKMMILNVQIMMGKLSRRNLTCMMVRKLMT